ncbi:MAG: FadR family transcriptional regulator [Desulfobacteraceae bacterium]|nr:FadR family transcriptional regulator [Desulfobacteraceae bacterium]
MKPIKKMRISTMIVEAIEGMITSENMQPGDKLPSENQLAKRLEVSRTSVREAVRMLELQGRVTVRQGKGIFLSETVAGWFEHHHESIEELFDVRILVESHAASRAVNALTDKHIDEFERIHRGYEAAIRDKDIDKAIQLDKDFHNKIAMLSGNSTLKQIMETIVSELTKGWICSLQVPERHTSTVIEHGEILNALRSRNRDEASSKMEDHLRNALHDIENYYKKGNAS